MLHNCVAGLEFTDRFCEWLRAMPLKGTTYFQCFQEVTEGLKQCLASEPNLKPEKVAFLTGFIQAYSSLRRSRVFPLEPAEPDAHRPLALRAAQA